MANIDTCGAHNGEEAIKYCNENSQIDLVLMDINMPVMNGFEATKELKNQTPTSNYCPNCLCNSRR